MQTSQRNPPSNAPVTLASDQHNPAAIDVDETNVYWISDSRSSINKVNKKGGAVTTIVSGQENIRRMIVDKGMIYFLTDDEVRNVSASGGNPTTLVAFSSIGGGKCTYYYFALDHKNVYFVYDPLEGELQLMKMAKSGGKPVILVPEVFALDGVVSDGVSVYWIEYRGDNVQKVSIEGGPAVTIGECTDPIGLAVDASSVYCSNKLGEVSRLPKTSGPSTILATVKDAGFDRLLVDDKAVYALSVLKGIYRIDKNGHPPELLVPLDRVSANFAIDSSNIYWSNPNEGTVMRRSK